ncbi:MAG: ribbon-helix-helix protein, CopG family [Clostridia bacterium]|nr:ribbon-helix-helix protein, CopG family [Clostridia bacterium]
MEKNIKITKKNPRKGDDGYKIVSVRMKDETIDELDIISAKTNRSRNEVINILLESALKIVTIEESDL